MSTSNAHFEAIGRVAYEWSRLELHIQLYIGALAELPANESLILTNPGNMKTWLDMLRRLICEKYKDEKTRTQLLKTCDKLKGEISDKAGSLATRRNQVIHGIWSLSMGELFGEDYEFDPSLLTTATVKTLRKAGKTMMEDTQMTAAEVRTIAKDIRAALYEFMKFVKVLIDASPHKLLPSSP